MFFCLFVCVFVCVCACVARQCDGVVCVAAVWPTFSEWFVQSPTDDSFTEEGAISFGGLGAVFFNSTGSGGIVQTNTDATFGSIQYACAAVR